MFNSVKIDVFVLCDIEIWRMTLNINWTPLLYHTQLYGSFQRHQWIQTGVRRRSIRVKIGDFVGRVTLKFDKWPWKIGHLFYTTSSIVHHFKAIGDFLCRVTIEFDGWPWKTTGHLFYATPRFVHHFIVICDYKLESGNTQFEFGKNGRFFIHVTSKFDGWPSRRLGHLS